MRREGLVLVGCAGWGVGCVVGVARVGGRGSRPGVIVVVVMMVVVVV